MMRNLVLSLAAAGLLVAPAMAQPRPDRPGYDRPGPDRPGRPGHDRPGYDRPGPNRPVIVRPGPNGHRPGYWNGRAYYYPRGYGYRAWAIGQSLPRAYWGNQYWWVTGAADWRLPVVGPNRRWVRVGPDAVLVNIRNGRVIDVRRGVFW